MEKPVSRRYEAPESNEILLACKSIIAQSTWNDASIPDSEWNELGDF